MRFFVWLTLFALMFAGTGCGLFRSNRAKAEHRIPTPDHPVLTPATSLSGKIARVNASGKFVIVTFPVGQLPVVSQKFNVYQQNLKVGEIKITGPQLDDSVVADLVAGEAHPGDIVRE